MRKKKIIINESAQINFCHRGRPGLHNALQQAVDKKIIHVETRLSFPVIFCNVAAGDPLLAHFDPDFIYIDGQLSLTRPYFWVEISQGKTGLVLRVTVSNPSAKNAHLRGPSKRLLDQPIETLKAPDLNSLPGGLGQIIGNWLQQQSIITHQKLAIAG